MANAFVATLQSAVHIHLVLFFSILLDLVSLFETLKETRISMFTR